MALPHAMSVNLVCSALLSFLNSEAHTSCLASLNAGSIHRARQSAIGGYLSYVVLLGKIRPQCNTTCLPCLLYVVAFGSQDMWSVTLGKA
jgi:hypothetical protein